MRSYNLSASNMLNSWAFLDNISINTLTLALALAHSLILLISLYSFFLFVVVLHSFGDLWPVRPFSFISFPAFALTRKHQAKQPAEHSFSHNISTIWN